MKKGKGFLTIGYGKMEIQTFIQTLLKRRVDYVVDVRSSPYSSYREDYKKDNLKRTLEIYNISYEWKGESLGGRPADEEVYDEKGIVDYEKFAKTEKFLSGIDYLEELCKKNNVIIMCSEEEALNCHRFLLISKELAKRGYQVVHIKSESFYIIQAQMEDRLVKACFGDDTQLNLFGNMDQRIADSYVKQNKKYGYRRK